MRLLALSSVSPPILAALLPLCAGVLAVLAFAPFGWFLLAPLALALLLESLRTAATSGAALWRGWLFGVGLLGVGVFWIRISLNEFGNLPGLAAHLLTALFIAAMALYYGLFAWTLRRLMPETGLRALLLVFPGLWVLIEWLRGWFLSGFPWLTLGYSQSDSSLAGYAPLLGVYGVSLVVALSGVLLWGLWRCPGWRRWSAAVALVALWAGGQMLGTLRWSEPSGEPFTAAVVQANIPQSLKWEPDALWVSAQGYLDLTLAHLDAELIVWPETALPEMLDQWRAPLLDPLGERARGEGAEIVLGIPARDLDSGRYYNALISLGSAEDRYDKRHLVPFGEFLPLRALLGPLLEWFEVPMSDFSRGEAERPLLRVGQRLAGVSICYEDAFGAELVEALPEAEFLINVSNDAWFGDSLAPHQHLQIARMRALETRRYLLRATNTGISAIIDARAQVLGTVPAFVRGGVSAEIQSLSGATPFARWGNGMAVVLAGVLVVSGSGSLRRFWSRDRHPA